MTVAFYDTESRSFKAIDYYLSHTTQCDGKTGVCPDERIGGRNDVTLLSGDRRNGITTITYSRPLQTNEALNDRPIPSQGEVSVIAAFGPLNARREANAHSMTDKTTNDYRIDFSDLNDHDCSISLDDLVDENGPKPWPPAKLIGIYRSFKNEAVQKLFYFSFNGGELRVKAFRALARNEAGYIHQIMRLQCNQLLHVLVISLYIHK